MPTPRLALVLPLVAAACAVQPPSAPSVTAAEATTGPSVVWRGRIQCGPIPGMVSRTLNQPIEVAVAGNQATYHRQIRRGDTGGETEYVEQGSGTVAPDGGVTLTGAANAPSFRYSATYEGRLPPEGGSTRLTGVQRWSARTINSYDRPCSLVLRRS